MRGIRSVSVIALTALMFACSSTADDPGAADGSTTGDSATGSGGHDASSDTTSAPKNDSGDAGGSTDATVTDAPSQSTDGGLPDPLGPVPDGGLLVQFVKSDETAIFGQEEKSTGTITFGAPSASASDNALGLLTRTGGQATIGTSGAEELFTQRQFGFGTFRFRFSLAQCASTEELVNSPFAYFNDGTKAADGLVINREIDIEILCSEPWLINLTIWTEFTDESHLKNQARVLDTKTGTLYAFANDTEGTETGSESHPELMLPTFPQAGAFYEMGWTWAPDHLRYFMNINGTDVTLWDATDATRIPQLPMEQHFNLWAPGTHWSTGDKAAVPAKDATLAFDWFRYDPL